MVACPVEVNVTDRCRLVCQARLIKVIDGGCAPIGKVEHFELNAGFGIDLVANTPIQSRGGVGTYRVVFNKRPRTEIAQLQGAEIRAYVIHRQGY